MSSIEPPILCVAGTGPQVGKTSIACALMRRAYELGGHPVGIKPIDVACSYDDKHDLVSTDGRELARARGRPVPPLVVAPYRFASPLPPALAAQKSGLRLELDHFKATVEVAREHGNVVFVELAWGALTPLTPTHCGLDLAEALHAPIILVGPCQPGVESTLISLVECAHSRNIAVRGILMTAQTSDSDMYENHAQSMIADHVSTNIFPTIPHFSEDLDANLLAHINQHRILEGIFADAPNSSSLHP